MSDELTDLVVHLVDSVRKLGALLSDRMTNNVGASFSNMTLQQWIRLVAIVGAYCLLRPYIIKMGAKHQEKEFEKAQQAEITPNELRGELGIPEDSDSDDDDTEGKTTAADWGKKARRRQRNMIKQLLDAEEKRLQETIDEQEDKDIEEFLID